MTRTQAKMAFMAIYDVASDPNRMGSAHDFAVAMHDIRNMALKAMMALDTAIYDGKSKTPTAD